MDSGSAIVYPISGLQMHEVPSMRAAMLLIHGFTTRPWGWDVYGPHFALAIGRAEKIVKQGGVICMIQTDRAYAASMTSACIRHMRDNGWIPYERKVWQRMRLSTKTLPFSDVVFFHRVQQKPPKHHLDNANFRPGIWTYPCGQHYLEPIPEEMAELLVASTTAPGDLIVDAFAGTAMIGKVAKRRGRHYIGYEINPKITKIAGNVKVAKLSKIEPPV